MKKSIIYLAILASALFVASCSDDDDAMVDVTPDATCEDGVMNGDETGIDCGGSFCEPCGEGMTVLGRRTDLFVTNNDNGNISRYSVTGDSLVTFMTTTTAAEGIYFDATTDVVFQASRSALQLEAFTDVSTLMDGDAVAPAYTSGADLESPRELAVNGSSFVVADNGANKFFVYENTGSGFTLTSTVEVPFPVWGITFKGDDLYAVVDTTGDLAVYYDFLSNAANGVLRPSKRVTVEGIVRTHGITYDGADDVMVLTDIGDATDANTDGGFHVISDFSSKFDALSDGELLPVGMQVRVAGASTLMGNPIDVAYDSETDAVYVSEIGNGKVLGFTAIGSGGNLTPSFNKDLAMASSIQFSSNETDGNTGDSSSARATRLYATSTANGSVSVYDGSGVLVKTVATGSDATEGIYYNAMNDAIVQASRSGMALEYYGSFAAVTDLANIVADFAGGAELASPREIAVFGNKVVVSSNTENKFYVYEYNGSSFSLLNTFDAGFDTWGITFMGNTLLAVVDSTSDLAVYNNFLTDFSADGAITPTKRITVDGIIRTHGIDYSEADDVLIMTDIGDAADANTDGGFQVTQDFSTKLAAADNGGTLALSDQTRVAGSSTEMGNPIDVAYDHKTKTVFIAEIGNGKVLAFSDALNASGNIAPAVSNDLMAAASIYLYNN
ncbi:YncE family protein [Maribacter sp. Asnod2-G09]|uniref:YncE family protein n=1 Tax=Maribacter sp. Asnod2-G09 TaxID=3160577 RepID=UPI00386B7EF0